MPPLSLITAAATVIMAVATVAVATLTWQLVRVTRSMTRATESAAAATKAALHQNRPYLLVTGVRPFFHRHPVLNAQEPISRADIVVRNVGGSPAELVEVFASYWKYDSLRDPTEPKWETLNSGGSREISTPVVGVGEEMKAIPILMHWTAENIEAVEGGLERVAIYGLIRYRSGPKETYYTRFFWWFSPREEPNLYKANSSELNDRT